MALYLGNNKVKTNLNNITCCLNLISVKPTKNNVVLLSSDNFILKDLNGILLIPKEGEQI